VIERDLLHELAFRIVKVLDMPVLRLPPPSGAAGPSGAIRGASETGAPYPLTLDP
jgi:hypothetical protein